MKGIVIVLMLVVSMIGAPDRKTPGEEQDVPLSEQLEGLAPEPRIAYLRHLLSTGSTGPDVFFQLGVAFHESAAYDSALHYYAKAKEVDPDYTKAYVNMGVIYDELGQLLRALTLFEGAADIDSTDILAHAHAAFIRYQLEDYREAWSLLEQALRMGPDHPQPHFYLAIFFWENKIYREALREWEKVVELDGDGYLAAKARENIIMLQKVLKTAKQSSDWKPQL
ncbi:MAG: tetratricopeptide repeat protein [bacterium]|nr:MAG: tetratricopeptide repeat protein [bacterium]